MTDHLTQKPGVSRINTKVQFKTIHLVFEENNLSLTTIMKTDQPLIVSPPPTLAKMSNRMKKSSKTKPRIWAAWPELTLPNGWKVDCLASLTFASPSNTPIA